jgi:DNA primase catalytic subunit
MIFKVDVDIKVPDSWLKNWIETRKAILKSLGFKVKDIKVVDSSLRGFHAYIHAEGKKKLTPTECNMIQFLLGDDESRVLINQRRIARGIDWRTGNKLFSDVLWRRKEKFNYKKMKKIWERERRKREEGRFELLKLVAEERGWE